MITSNLEFKLNINKYSEINLKLTQKPFNTDTV